jgi:hypothetical protein
LNALHEFAEAAADKTEPPAVPHDVAWLASVRSMMAAEVLVTGNPSPRVTCQQRFFDRREQLGGGD